MGGRGAASGFVTRLPNYQRAEVLGSKVKNYLLNPNKSNGKHLFFKSIGYNMKNSHRLEHDIRKGLKTNKALAFKRNKYGNAAYQVIMELGIGEKVSVLTAWQIDKGSNTPRFITAYKHRGGNKNE